MPIFDSSTPEYRLGSVVMDTANHTLFEPPREEGTDQHPRLIFKLKYANKGIEAVNICNILNQKKRSSLVFHHILS